MQTMSTDQQARYPNAQATHQPGYAYAINPEYGYPPQHPYAQQMRIPPMYNQQPIYNQYGQATLGYPPNYQAPQMMYNNGPRPMHPAPLTVVRPQNEASAMAAPFVSSNPYSMYPATPVSTSNTYNQPQYNPYQVGLQTAQQSSYGSLNNSRQNSVSSEQQQAAATSQPAQLAGKREKKPLLVQNPVTKEKVDLPTPTPAPINAPSNSTDQRPAESITDSPAVTENPTKEADKTQIQANFRKDFARALAGQSQQTEKNPVVPEPEEPTEPLAIKPKPADPVPPPPPSTKDSQPSKPIKVLEPVQPDPSNIPKESLVEEKPVNHDDSQADRSDSPSPVEVEPEKVSADVQPVLETPLATEPAVETPDPPTKSAEPDNVTLSDSSESESRSLEKTPSMAKRAAYTIQELLKKRTDPSSQQRPRELRHIEGVTKPPAYIGGSSMPSKGSISLEIPKLHNRAENAYVPADRNRIDGNEKFLRDVKAILNKLTPQKYDELVKKLDELELNSDQRLEGMIRVIFSKAVDEPTFCSLYASVCKHYERKQVTVPDEKGELVAHYFRQILLARCQREFQNDYRQEIEYEKRLKEVEAVTDEKLRREADEQLQEDLGKAKRKKFGNIFFIGELFKLQMLTAPIMYDCIQYLLREKADEESLECLCRLLRTIGKELDAKAADKPSDRVSLEKSYRDLESIANQRQTSSRIRFMIQDLLEQRKASWVARRAEIKPLTIDEIHEAERIKREQQERDQENDRMRRRETHRGGHSQQQYSESRGNRGSGTRQASNRTVDDRNEPRFDVDSVRLLHSSDKKNPGTMPISLAPPRAWSKGSGVEKKTEDTRSYSARNSKNSSMPNQASKPKTGPYPNPPPYTNQRQPSRELPRDGAQRGSDSSHDHWKKANNQSVDVADPKVTSSPSSRDSSVSKTATTEKKLTASLSTDSTATSNAEAANATFDEEKTQARVHSLIEEFTGNYSDATDRPVKEALEDLVDFATANVEHQAIIVRELFTNVFEAKPRARKAVGHLLDAAIQKEILSEQGLIEGFKLIVQAAPDFAVDIPLIWQYIAEIVGAFIGAPSSNMSFLKPLIASLPDDKVEKFFQAVIRFASEFLSKDSVQRFWQASDLSLDDIFKSDSVDPAVLEEYSWLSVPVAETAKTKPSAVAETTKPKASPVADPKLVKLFKSVNEQESPVSDEDIIKYINENMNKADKFYIRNIVLSYLEACLINRDSQKKIQEAILNQRISVLRKIVSENQETEIQAVYAIQNFVHDHEHPSKMAPLLFEYFYESDCVSEEAFYAWLKNPNKSENEGHSVVEISTKDFFTWLEQAEEEEES